MGYGRGIAFLGLREQGRIDLLSGIARHSMEIGQEKKSRSLSSYVDRGVEVLHSRRSNMYNWSPVARVGLMRCDYYR